MDGLQWLAALSWWTVWAVALKLCVLGLAVRFVLKFCIALPLAEMWRKYHG